MNKLALKVLPTSKFQKNLSTKVEQLSCSTSILDVCNTFKTKEDSKRQVVCIIGHPGSGKSTYAQALIQEVIQRGFMNESDILYLELGPYDDASSVWNSGIEMAKASGNRDVAAVLASGTASSKLKLKALVKLLDNNYKIICFDNLSAKNEKLYSLVLAIVEKLKSSVFCITNLTNLLTIKEHANMRITIGGLKCETIQNLVESTKIATSMKVVEVTAKQLLNNPKAVQLYIYSCLEFGVDELKQSSQVAGAEHPVECVLEMIWEWLEDCEKQALLQLGRLRQPLPVKTDVSFLARAIRIGLVKHEVIVMHGDRGLALVFMDSCVGEFFQNKSIVISSTETEMKFNILDHWTTLLSSELSGLVQDARNYMWPFIPEKWQYVTNAGEKESYNVKDLITSRSKDVPHLTQLDILQECLHHSIVRKDYTNMAAIVFVLDRFIYWQGGSKLLLSIVDSIVKGDPNLPIAPQLVIRKARILRTSGGLQGAEKVLDRLLNEKEKLGVWKYKEKHDHHLVRAVCIQIKGEIQASLGQWSRAATLLLDSVQLFKTLPKVDKKGLSCSLGLLVNTLQSMSIKEYEHIASRYSLGSPHPYLQAYNFALDAAKLALFTPLFFARHKRRAGEMLLEYSRLFTDPHLRLQFLNNSLKELKESLQAHKTIDSLNSREQFYEFISALYKVSGVIEERGQSQKSAQDLRSVSMLLYDHYCRHQTSIIQDASSQQLINSALFTLGLPTFEDTMHLVTSISEQQSIVTSSKTPLEPTSLPRSNPTSTVDRFAETLQTVTLCDLKTVDRSRSTVLTADEKNCGVVDDDERKTGYADVFSDSSRGQIDDLTKTSVHECESSRYDPVLSQWRIQRTLMYIGEQLNLAKGKKGAQRDPFMVEYLNQDEPLGKYVGKRYKKALGVEQYEEDVRCQMTARYYVGLFNQDLYHKGIEVSPIQFLPVVMLRLLNHKGERASCVYNVEPYIDGDFTKLTNNWSFVDKKGEGSKLVLAFSHYTYEKSNQSLIIVDHQGWTSSDHQSTTFLTDPQIHSIDKKLFGTGNLGTRGIKTFWKDMHTECNEICLQLGLQRPDGK